MPFYTGSSEDGSDMREVQGMYINPDNPNEWSNQMYPKQVKILNLKEEIGDYADGKYSLYDLYQQIQNKTCPLPRRCRDYVLSHYDEKGNFKQDNQ